MTILIQLKDDHPGMLFDCRNSKKRGFGEWSMEMLLQEAIYEFWLKYRDEERGVD